jgi:hypothetical protein
MLTCATVKQQNVTDKALSLRRVSASETAELSLSGLKDIWDGILEVTARRDTCHGAHRPESVHLCRVLNLCKEQNWRKTL